MGGMGEKNVPSAVEKNNYSRICEHVKDSSDPEERRRIDADEAERPNAYTGRCRRVCTFLIVAKIITL